MSPIPSFLGNNRRSNNIFEPFSLEIWDPFKDLPFPSSLSRESSLGMKKEEVEDDTVIKISGQRYMEKEEKKDDTWHRLEISSGRFTRKFKLPENVKMEQVKASMENGVLTVIVPKEETKKPLVKSIKISA